MKLALPNETDFAIAAVGDPQFSPDQPRRMRSGEATHDRFPRCTGKNHASLVHREISMTGPTRGDAIARSRKKRMGQIPACCDGVELNMVLLEARFVFVFDTARPPDPLITAIRGDAQDRVLSYRVCQQFSAEQREVVEGKGSPEKIVHESAQAALIR